MITSRIFKIAMLVMVAVSPWHSFAAPPDTINYQARLTDLTGVALPDGDYNISVSLYESATGGAPVWTEARTGGNRVPLTNGLFAVSLGELNAFAADDVDFTEELFLGLTVGGSSVTPDFDSEMTPRRVVGATAFAFVSDTLDGKDSSDFVWRSDIATIATSSSDTILTIRQEGSGDIFALENGLETVLTVLNNGNVGIGNDNPSQLLAVGTDFSVTEAGEVAVTNGSVALPAFRFSSDLDTGIFQVADNTLAFTTGGSEAAVLDEDGNLDLAGGLVDDNDDLGDSGEILQSTATGFEWVTPGSLGINDGSFLGLTDTPSSYTAGSLLFTSASGVVEDNSNLFWDDINNRLGIGTTTPSLPLYVDSANTGSVAWLDHAGDSSNALILGDAADPTNNTGLFMRTTGIARINTGLGGELHFSDNGEVNMMIDGDGSVGIGTLDAEAINGGARTLLHVENDVGAGDIEVARFEGGTDADNTYGVLRVNNANDRGFFVKGGRQVGDTPHVVMGTTDFEGNMTDVMSFLSGNVGIGSSTPSARLVVAKSSNTDYTFRVENGGGQAQGVNITGGNTGSDASLLKIQNFSDTTFFEVTDGNSYFNNGNVGIGTNSLDSLLTLEQQTDNKGLLLRGFDNQTANNVSLSLDGSGNTNLSASRVLNLESGASVGGSLGSEGETGLTWDAFSQFKFTGENFRIPLSVQSGGSADMFNVTSNGGDAGDVLTIDQNGNIGVGATVPGSKLHVDLSAGEVARFGDGLSASAIWGTNIGLISEENDARLTTRTAVTDLAFYTGGVANNLIEGTERMRVDAALGHVGIGDTDPDTRLSVSSDDIVVGKFERASSSGIAALQFKNNTAGMFIGIDGNENFAIATDKFLGTNPAMVVDRTGSLGVGVAAPTAQLHTDGSVRFAFFSAGTLTTDNDGNVTASSDERLKHVIGDYSKGIDALLEIEPIQYGWREETGYDTDSLYTGFSAQNVQEAIPEAVGEDKRGFLTLSDRPIIATIVNAIKELWEEVTDNSDRIADLEDENQQLESRLIALESQMAEVQGRAYEPPMVVAESDDEEREPDSGPITVTPDSATTTSDVAGGEGTIEPEVLEEVDEATENDLAPEVEGTSVTAEGETEEDAESTEDEVLATDPAVEAEVEVAETVEDSESEVVGVDVGEVVVM